MVELKNLNKTYYLANHTVEAIKDVSLTVNDGEVFGVIGYSGAGKSSLVRCINLLEVPDSGTITVDGTAVTWEENGVFKRLSNHDMKQVRKKIGMIFQHFNLLDRSTVFDNIAYPLKHSGLSKERIRDRVHELLELVDLTDKIRAYPAQLSGGQKQRVAIARALANNPSLLLSDEATSALDPEATESILSLLKTLNKKLNFTIILITHEMAVIKSICHKVAVMEKGKVVEQGDVYSIFAAPEQDITRKFIASQSSLSKIGAIASSAHRLIDTGAGSRLVRLQFEKDVVGDALISEVSRKYNVNLSIVLANVDLIQGVPLGGIVAVIQGDTSNVDNALTYFRSKNVQIFEYAKTDISEEV